MSNEPVTIIIPRAAAVWLRGVVDNHVVWATQRRDASIHDTESYWLEARTLDAALQVRAAIDEAVAHHGA
jgi:hypothetical protein